MTKQKALELLAKMQNERVMFTFWRGQMVSRFDCEMLILNIK